MNFVLKILILFAVLNLSSTHAKAIFPLNDWIDKELRENILLAQGNNPVMDVKPLGDPVQPPKEEYPPLQEVFPIWGKKARERGYNLPLPIGVALNYIYMKQGISFSNVEVSLEGEDMELPPDSVTFEDPVRADNIGVLRTDLWVFPFLNIYGLFGYLGGSIKTGVGIPGDLTADGNPMKVDADIEYNGGTYGFGIDVAGGYESIFVLIDSNFAWTNVDVSDTLIKTFAFSPKIGILLEDKELFGRGTIWLGTMYLNFDMTVNGSIATSKISAELPDVLGADSLDYSAKISPIGKWNMLIGGSWELTPHWLFLAEVGFIKRTQFIMGGSYRF
jgi:hypothetical protein